MYLSYLLYWLAWIPLTNFFPPAFILFGAFILAYTYAAKHEERVLKNSFGQEYANYHSNTGRFLPKVT